jgi:hypothetical protein
MEMNHDRSGWLAALLGATRTEAAATGWLDTRFAFTSRVATKLCEPIQGKPDTHVVYAVWLRGQHQRPVYIGQSADPLRRLNDLPIGESHHLSNSFPPEIWERVLVVDWESMVPDKGSLAQSLRDNGLHSPTKGAMDIVGLGIEFHLQQDIKPMFNARKKLRGGSWRQTDFTRSGSLGARAAGIPGVRQLAGRIAERINGTSGEETHAWEVHPHGILTELEANRGTP